MRNSDGSRKINYFIIVFLTFVLSSSLVLSGCETVRRKFTRKKKVDQTKSMEVPVLEPMEYPKKVYTLQELYANHYASWKVWFGEFATSLEENSDNRKRQLFLLNKAIVELEQMKDLLNDLKSSALGQQLEAARRLYDALSAPVLSFDFTTIKLDTQRIDKVVRKSFSIEQIKDALKP